MHVFFHLSKIRNEPYLAILFWDNEGRHTPLQGELFHYDTYLQQSCHLSLESFQMQVGGWKGPVIQNGQAMSSKYQVSHQITPQTQAAIYVIDFTVT